MANEATVLTHSFGHMAVIVQSISVIMGVCFVFIGFMKLKKYGEMRTMMSAQMSIAGPLLMLLAGAILLVLPKFINGMLLAFWGNYSGMQYPTGGTGWAALEGPVLEFVRLLGAIGFIRGIVLIARAGGQQAQPGSAAKGITHIFTGILCLHIQGTIHLIKTMLGLN